MFSDKNIFNIYAFYKHISLRFPHRYNLKNVFSGKNIFNRYTSINMYFKTFLTNMNLKKSTLR